MKIKPLFAIATTLLLQVSCSSKNGDSSAKPAPKENESGTPEGNSVDGKARSKSTFLWLSDKEQVFIEPCKVGQVMVDAQCWDEVHFKPSGVTLSKPGATFSFFENGALPSDYLKSQYVYVDQLDIGNGPHDYKDLPRKNFGSLGHGRISEWIFENIEKNGVQQAENDPSWMHLQYGTYYDFAPREIAFSLPQEDRTLVQARVATAKFRLVLSGDYPAKEWGFERRAWRMKGTLEVCGKILRLETLTQGEIEKVCATGPRGAVAEFNLPIPNGRMNFVFSAWTSTPSDDFPNEVIYQLNFPDPTKATPPPAEPNPEIKSTEVEK